MHKSIKDELKQRAEEGVDIRPLEQRFEQILCLNAATRDTELRRFLDELEALPSPLADREPSDLEGILALRPDDATRPTEPRRRSIPGQPRTGHLYRGGMVTTQSRD